MKHRLDGAKFKIVRAKKQLDCLNLEIAPTWIPTLMNSPLSSMAT